MARTSTAAQQPVSVNLVIQDDLTAHVVDLTRFEADMRNRVLAMLEQLSNDVRTLVAKVDPTGVVRLSAQQNRLNKLADQATETIRTAYREIKTETGADLQDLAKIEGSYGTNLLATSIPIEVNTVALGPKLLSALADETMIGGATTAEWWAEQAGSLKSKFFRTMREGIALGEGVGDLVRRVRGTRAGGFKDGIMQTTTRGAETLVRSSVMTVANRAREATWEANADLLKGLRWVSALDGRTSDQCKVRDGLLYSVTDHKPLDHSIPWGLGPGSLHYGCRSTSIPITKSWKELGIDADDLPPGTRASMNGEVPENMTYEGWLRGKPKAFQDSMLGVGKADLWRQGRIRFRDLVNNKGRPLTLKELAEKAGVDHSNLMKRVWARAGEKLSYQGRLRRHEAGLLNSPVEQMLVLDKKGNLLKRNTGTHSRVYLPEGVDPQGKILTHNHPSGASFSDGDFKLLLHEKPGELRAVTADHRHSLKIDEAMLPNNFNRVEAERDILEVYDKHRAVGKARVLAGDIDEDKAKQMYSHRIWSEASRKFPWLVYKREKW